jgi:hypothetical protein
MAMGLPPVASAVFLIAWYAVGDFSSLPDHLVSDSIHQRTRLGKRVGRVGSVPTPTPGEVTICAGWLAGCE